jgi:hypothetical protein
MTFRKSLTTLAAVALVAFAVSMAQAGSCGTPCPSKAQAGGCQHEMKAQGCQGQMQKSECCKGLPADQCCKTKMKAGCGSKCEAHGDKCDGSCKMMMKRDCGGSCNKMMMKRGCGDSCGQMMMNRCGDSCEMDNGCKWDCNGIWGDYDCSNPGGRSLFNCCSKMHRQECRMIVIRKDGDDEDCMSMPEMGCGKDGRRMIFIERHEGGPGEKECQVRVMQHKCDANCKEHGCPMMNQMHQGSQPPCGGTPPAQAPQGSCPHSGK